MGIKELSVGRSDIYMIDPRIIRADEAWNSRDDYGDIEALKNSIVASGLKTPLRGYLDREGKLCLTDGFRRRQAIMLAIAEGHDIKAVKFIPEERYANQGDHLLTQLIANDGKPLTPLEQAKVVRKLLQFGWSEQEIAEKTGKTIQTIKNYLELSSAPPEVHQMVSNGEVSATLAVSTIRATEEIGEAVETLQGAIASAKAEGKTKATAKHVDRVTSETRSTKPNLKKVISQILDISVVSRLAESTEISVSNELYQQLLAALGRET